MDSAQKKRAVVAITGASGATIGIRTAAMLVRADAEVYCIVSDAAAEIIPDEIDGASDAAAAL